MRLAALFLLASSGFAQTATLSLSGPASVRPGAAIQVNLSLSGATPAALQWTLGVPTGFPYVVPAVGQRATEASKVVDCNATGLCLLYGNNVNQIQAGVIAGYSFSIPANQAAGPIQFGLAEPVAASSTAAEIVSAVGAPLSILVLAKTDINGDGTTNPTDVALMSAQAKKQAPCTDDQNGDAKCNIIDVLIVIMAAYGL